MAFPSIFLKETAAQLSKRIDLLTNQTPALWGKMNAGQMLSHCCVTYQQILGENKVKPGFLMKWLLKSFFKNSMVNQVPYKHNLPTVPDFVRINQEIDIESEKQKLKGYISKIQKMGAEKLIEISHP